jgi:hypothetical protein
MQIAMSDEDARRVVGALRGVAAECGRLADGLVASSPRVCDVLLDEAAEYRALADGIETARRRASDGAASAVAS